MTPTGQLSTPQSHKFAGPHNVIAHEYNDGHLKDGSKSADYEDTTEERISKNEVNGKRLQQPKENSRNSKQVAVVEEDDEDDELSLKERLISPLTIGIFETVNTRCGRFLKAHTKRLTRALYARAKDL